MYKIIRYTKISVPENSSHAGEPNIYFIDGHRVSCAIWQASQSRLERMAKACNCRPAYKLKIKKIEGYIKQVIEVDVPADFSLL